MGLRRGMLALLFWGLMGPAMGMAATPTPSLLDVSVNGVDTGQVVMAQVEGKDLWLSSSDWSSLGVSLTEAEEHQARWSAHDLGVSFDVDDATQSVHLTVPVSRLPSQHLSSSSLSMPTLSNPAGGVMLNYDLSTAFDGKDLALSLGHDVRWNMAGGLVSTSGQVNERMGAWTYRRLYSSWTQNHYDTLHVWQAGDVFASSLMGNTTNLLGLRFAKDPSLNPYVPSYPLPTINGVVVDPGTLVVLSDASVVSRLAVKQGPFALSPYQLRNGANELTTVLTDGLGRQQVIDRTDFYATPMMLRDGLTTWDVSAGLVRDGVTEHYGLPVASLKLSKGFGWLTGSVGAQMSSDGQNAMVGTMVRLGHAGVLTTQVGASHRADGQNGWSYQVRWDYASDNWNAYALHQQEHHFYQLGNPLLTRFRPTEQTRAGVMWRSPSYAWQTSLAYNAFTVDHIHSRQVDASVRWSHGPNNLGLNASFDLIHHAPQVFLEYRYTFDGGSVGASAQNNFGETFQANLVHRFASDVTTSTRASWATTRQGHFINAQTDVYTPTHQAEVMVDHGPGGTLTSGRFMGSVYLGSGTVKPVALSQDSWMRVKVPNVPNVGVLLGGRYVGKTDKHGVLVVGQIPSLTPLRVRLNPENIPFGVELHQMDQTVAAPRREGIEVSFPVATMDARAFELVTPKGEDLPVESQTEDGHLVGYQGQLFLEHPTEGQTMRVAMPSGQACFIHVPKPLPAFGMNLKLTCQAQP